MDRTIEVMNENGDETASEVPRMPADSPARRAIASSMSGTLASIGVAFFPKCPFCWAAYLSVFGIAGLEQIPYTPWLSAVLVAVMLINLASVWLRGHSTGQMSGFYLVSAGALVIMVSRISPVWESAAITGVVLTLAGSLISALSNKNSRLFAWALPKSSRDRQQGQEQAHLLDKIRTENGDSRDSVRHKSY